MTWALTPENRALIASVLRKPSPLWGENDIQRLLNAVRTEASASLETQTYNEVVSQVTKEAEGRIASLKEEVERLKDIIRVRELEPWDVEADYEQRLQTAEAQRDGLLEAIEPFANMTLADNWGDRSILARDDYTRLKVGDFRRAKQARDACKDITQ